MLKLTLLIASFIFGAIPVGYVTARIIRGIDIRQFGSGNVGATNVFRTVGKGWGFLVFVLDFSKGFIIPFLAYSLGEFEPYFFIVLGVLAILGHNWTPFLKFRGGKGVATSLGVLFALSFCFSSFKLILPLSLGVWVIVFLLSRVVSLASILASFTFVVLSLFLSSLIEVKILAMLLFLLILIRHKNNIKRILKGTENRF
ncbi:MAG: glycerol-3-phosphate 1-O-acyltransferase PlsY [Candidatus Omnitrophica bacterium]|nr:glycerol-3-phosphate 1-O-acyltransferase PlsY [Candidatus Omnitrophota bacterium]MCF7893770.1 glycerol-3-phosphate 1-O-acyltransferase PlsY [Candidatus Omnitrophota bacterium]